MAVVSAQLVAKFLDQHPLISLEIILSDDHVDLFASGIDVAFRAGPIRDENLVARRLMLSKLVVVASPACIKAHGRAKDVEALSGYPCLALRGNDGCAVWPLEGPGGKATIQVKARLTVNGMEALVAAAKVGLGAALVPEQLVTEAIAAGTLVRLLPQFCHDGGGIYAVYPSRRHPPAALRAFIDFALGEAESALAK